MRWTNPGHQLDGLGEKFLKVKQLYIYGTDEVAKKAYDVLRWLYVDDNFEINFVVDDTVTEENPAIFCGRPVLPFVKSVCARLDGMQEESAVLLPFISKTNERAILENLGVKNIFYLNVSYNRRDNFIQNFLCVWLMYAQGKLLSHATNYLVTSRCNLNCKHCLNFNDSIEYPQDIPFDEFRKHIDIVFQKFDYVYSFHLSGGEPLIAADLERKITYINDNFRERIFEFFVITNGTLIPRDGVIAALQKIDGGLLIDDHSATCRQTKIGRLKEVLDTHGISYSVNKVSAWFDLEAGIPQNFSSDSELEAHKDACNSYLHEFAEGKIFACCYQKYAERAGLTKVSKDEYINIQDTSKMEILEFRQGYTKKGYVDFCKFCKGIGACAKLVLPAVQLPHRTPVKKEQDRQASIPGLVSICVPIYNTAPYLKRCIDSLLAQTYTNIEIILVDDGSADGSGTICDAYATTESRIHVIHQPNGGEASARNAALASAHGQYVMFIDSDDEYLPCAVQLCVDAAVEASSDLVIGGYLERHEDAEFFSCCHQRKYSPNEFARDYIFATCPNGIQYLATTVNAKLFLRDIITQNGISFDSHFVIGNDAVFMCEYLRHASNIYSIFEPIYIYYKYRIEERVQGMAWHYPDGFFIYIYIIDNLINICSLDVDAHKNVMDIQYKNYIYGFINSFLDMQNICSDMQRRISYLCSNIDLLYPASKQSFEAAIPEDRDIPLRLISFLIIDKNYDLLASVIELCAKLRKLAPTINSHSRLMVRIDDADVSFRESTLSKQNHIATQNNDDCGEKTVLFNKLSQIYEDVIIKIRESGNISISNLIHEEHLFIGENFDKNSGDIGNNDAYNKHISQLFSPTLLNRILEYHKRFGFLATVKKIFSQL
ncbi:glycosyltransferase [uncultured Desulfovibrio sp.]|uniref:glycosyltransferase n=1 Tax=uncultured Desulfovibrio sp. TaxID=167968 RepID=UPI0026017402|nr:glycosyltransferase [uncultured Desulfovibrio sp.]